MPSLHSHLRMNFHNVWVHVHLQTHCWLEWGQSWSCLHVAAVRSQMSKMFGGGELSQRFIMLTFFLSAWGRWALRYAPVTARLRGQMAVRGLSSRFFTPFFFCQLPTSSTPSSLLQSLPLERCSESLPALVKRLWFPLVIWHRPLCTFCLGTGALNAESSPFTRQPPSLSLSPSLWLTVTPLLPPGDMDNPEHLSTPVCALTRMFPWVRAGGLDSPRSWRHGWGRLF